MADTSASSDSALRGTDFSSMKVSAVCISRNTEAWNIPDIAFHNYTGGWKPFRHEKTIQRVEYLAERRNLAVSQTLTRYPDTEHIMMIDSYYVHQNQQIKGLIQEYARLILSDYQNGCILGASAWILDKTRIRSRLRFYDGWTTPEGTRLKLQEVEKTGGFIRARSVGGCYLYPRWVWERVRYGVPQDLHGCEHNWLCEHSGLPVLLSLNQRLWREPVVYSWAKRIRVSLHAGKLLGR
jgi:hypothetical protein